MAHLKKYYLESEMTWIYLVPSTSMRFAMDQM